MTAMAIIRYSSPNTGDSAAVLRSLPLPACALHADRGEGQEGFITVICHSRKQSLSGILLKDDSGQAGMTD